MKIIKNLKILIILFLIISCSKNEKVSVVKEKNINTQMIEAFREGYEELEMEMYYLQQKNSMRLNFYIHNHSGLLKRR